MSVQIISSHAWVGNGTITYYNGIMGFNQPNATSGNEIRFASPMPTDGSFTNMRVALDTAPGNGNSVTITLRKNQIDTGCAVTISDTSIIGSYTGSGISFSAGDTISYTFASDDVDTGDYGSVTIEFTPTIADNTILLGSSDGFYFSDDKYFSLTGHSTARDLVNTCCVFPIAGTLKNLYVKTHQNVIANITLTVVDDGDSASSLTATVTTGNDTDNDTSNTVTVNVEDVYSLKCVSSGTERGCFGLVFVPCYR